MVSIFESRTLWLLTPDDVKNKLTSRPHDVVNKNFNTFHKQLGIMIVGGIHPKYMLLQMLLERHFNTRLKLFSIFNKQSPLMLEMHEINCPQKYKKTKLWSQHLQWFSSDLCNNFEQLRDGMTDLQVHMNSISYLVGNQYF